MSGGMIIYGAAGTGKTTLGRETAQLLHCQHVDIDDHIWRWDTEKPYTQLCAREERIQNLMNAISSCEHFVMTGSMWSIRERFNPLFDLGVFITAPTDIRMERLRKREFAMFGERILPGGDMHAQSVQFFNEAAQYDTGKLPLVCLQSHEQWTAELPCPVMRIDGTQPIAENAVWIAEQFLRVQAEKSHCHS